MAVAEVAAGGRKEGRQRRQRKRRDERGCERGRWKKRDQNAAGKGCAAPDAVAARSRFLKVIETTGEDDGSSGGSGGRSGVVGGDSGGGRRNGSGSRGARDGCSALGSGGSLDGGDLPMVCERTPARKWEWHSEEKAGEGID